MLNFILLYQLFISYFNYILIIKNFRKKNFKEE